VRTQDCGYVEDGYMGPVAGGMPHFGCYRATPGPAVPVWR